jgi:hypothetical protein
MIRVTFESLQDTIADRWEGQESGIKVVNYGGWGGGRRALSVSLADLL